MKFIVKKLDCSKFINFIVFQIKLFSKLIFLLAIFMSVNEMLQVEKKVGVNHLPEMKEIKYNKVDIPKLN